MTTSVRTAPAARRTGVALRVLGAGALLVSGVLHLLIAQDLGPLVSGGAITLGGLFVAQGVVASAVALWVLVRGDLPAWAVAAVVAIASLAALLVSTAVQVPAIGPFPTLYDPLWYRDKVLAAVSAAIASVVALVALAQLRRRR